MLHIAIYRPDFKGVTIHSDEQSDMIRVKQDDVDTAEILVSTASGYGCAMSSNGKKQF